MLLHVDICDPIRQNEFQVTLWPMIIKRIFFLFTCSLFEYNFVLFPKSAQIAFLNFKCHFFQKKRNFRLHIFLSLSSHIFGVKHATEMCDIPF